MPILNSISQMQKEMQIWRRDLHKIPEIGLEEYKTSAYIKSKLDSWNIDYKSGYSNTGIVAWIKGNKGDSDKSIGLRADFDALPMPEKNNFEHKSTIWFMLGTKPNTETNNNTSGFVSLNIFSR